MLTHQEPLISLLMAVYNTEKFLQEAVESVIAQSYKNWELICINDGSTDGSLKILQKLEKEDSRIIVIDHNHSGSASITRNAGLKKTKGDFIAMLDSDDKIEATYLRKLVDRQLRTEADIVLSSTEFWDYQRDLITEKLCGLQGDVNPIISGKESFLLSLDWRISGIGICKANLLKEIGYDTTGMNGDEYTTRLLFLKASSVAFCDARYFYRNNQNSTTKKFSVKYFDGHHTQYRLYHLIKNVGVEEEIVKYWKENLIKSLVNDYRVYIRRRNELSQRDKEKAMSILKANSVKLHQEFLKPPRLNNKLKDVVYFLILLNSNFTFSFSVLWQTKKNIQGSFKRINSHTTK